MDITIDSDYNDNCSFMELKKILKKYVDDPKYLYKYLYPCYIIVIKKIKTTQTDEYKKVFDPKHAEYHLDSFKTIEIRNCKFPYQEMVCGYKKIIKGKKHIGEFYSLDTLYYKTLETAYFNNVYSVGSFSTWFCNGCIETKGISWRNNGSQEILIGKFEGWYNNGNLVKKCYYENGVLHGPYEEWWPNGNPYVFCFYKNGFLEDEYRIWRENGQIKCKYQMKDGMIKGKYEKWFSNQIKKIECNYVNDVLHGEYCEWDRFGDIITKCNFANGFRCIELEFFKIS